MKMAKNMTAPELGEKMELLRVTHLAAISASFPLLNDTSQKCSSMPPRQEPWLDPAPSSREPTLSPSPPRFTASPCLCSHSPFTVPAAWGKLPAPGREGKVLGGQPPSPPAHHMDTVQQGGLKPRCYT